MQLIRMSLLLILELYVTNFNGTLWSILLVRITSFVLIRLLLSDIKVSTRLLLRRDSLALG